MDVPMLRRDVQGCAAVVPGALIVRPHIQQRTDVGKVALLRRDERGVSIRRPWRSPCQPNTQQRSNHGQSDDALRVPCYSPGLVSGRYGWASCQRGVLSGCWHCLPQRPRGGKKEKSGHGRSSETVFAATRAGKNVSIMR